MGVLFVGGVMNLLWVAGLTILIAMEKLLPAGLWLARIAGIGMVFGGTAFILA
jgi:predicted metal-binding membrane protein